MAIVRHPGRVRGSSRRHGLRLLEIPGPWKLPRPRTLTSTCPPPCKFPQRHIPVHQSTPRRGRPGTLQPTSPTSDRATIFGQCPGAVVNSRKHARRAAGWTRGSAGSCLELPAGTLMCRAALVLMSAWRARAACPLRPGYPGRGGTRPCCHRSAHAGGASSGRGSPPASARCKKRVQHNYTRALTHA